MTLEFRRNGTLIPARAIKIGGLNQTIPGGVQGMPSSAWYGEVSSATWIIDDPFGEYEFRAWDVMTADETAATAKPRVFTGWVERMRISRGGYGGGSARIIELDIVDQNACLGFGIFRANSAQRPAETDVERIQFGLESQPMAWTPVVAGDRTNLTDNIVNLQEAQFARTYPVELFTSTAGRAGKIFYVYWNQENERLEFYYDTIPNYPAADVGISNVRSEVVADPTGLFYPSRDAQLARSGNEVMTGELLDFVGGSVFGENTATIDRLSPTPLSPIAFRREFVRRSDQIGRVDTANAIVVADLAGHAIEEDTIVVTIRVPPEQVNDIEAGQRVPYAKFTHLPGYEDGPTINCIRRNVVPPKRRGGWYEIHLELSDKAKFRELDGGDPDDLPPDPVTCDVDDIAVVQSAGGSLVSDDGNPGVDVHGASWPAPPTPGNLLICAWTLFAQQGLTVGTMDGWSLIEDAVSFVGSGGSGGNLALYWKLAEADEPTEPFAYGGSIGASNLAKSQNYLLEVSGVDSFDTFVSGFSETQTHTPGLSITPTADLIGFGFTVQEHHSPGGGPFTNDPPVSTVVYEGNLSDAGNPYRWLGYQIIDGATGSYSINPGLTLVGNSVKWATITAFFYCSGSDPDTPCISAGQPSQEDEPVTPAPDGATATFFTRCPFADGSLSVKVDNTNQTPAIIATDGANRSFTLAFNPTPTELITVNYLGHP